MNRIASQYKDSPPLTERPRPKIPPYGNSTLFSEAREERKELVPTTWAHAGPTEFLAKANSVSSVPMDQSQQQREEVVSAFDDGLDTKYKGAKDDKELGERMAAIKRNLEASINVSNNACATQG